jgi:hypothetical protein
MTIAATIQQMMNDWNNATDEQRADALAKAAKMAAAADRKVKANA